MTHDNELPPGWCAYTDVQTSRTYYAHAPSGNVRWDPPPLQPPPPPPPPPPLPPPTMVPSVVAAPPLVPLPPVNPTPNYPLQHHSHVATISPLIHPTAAATTTTSYYPTTAQHPPPPPPHHLVNSHDSSSSTSQQQQTWHNNHTSSSGTSNYSTTSAVNNYNNNGIPHYFPPHPPSLPMQSAQPWHPQQPPRQCRLKRSTSHHDNDSSSSSNINNNNPWNNIDRKRPYRPLFTTTVPPPTSNHDNDGNHNDKPMTITVTNNVSIKEIPTQSAPSPPTSITSPTPTTPSITTPTPTTETGAEITSSSLLLTNNNNNKHRTKLCSKCKQTVAWELFSKRQWTSGEEVRQCKHCVMESLNKFKVGKGVKKSQEGGDATERNTHALEKEEEEKNASLPQLKELEKSQPLVKNDAMEQNDNKRVIANNPLTHQVSTGTNNTPPISSSAAAATAPEEVQQPIAKLCNICHKCLPLSSFSKRQWKNHHALRLCITCAILAQERKRDGDALRKAKMMAEKQQQQQQQQPQQQQVMDREEEGITTIMIKSEKVPSCTDTARSSSATTKSLGIVAIATPDNVTSDT